MNTISERNAYSSPLFSILIPSWNNLAFLKLCIESIEKNSFYTHEILVHVNEGTDGSLEYIQNKANVKFTHSAENIGVCYALNGLRTLATTNYIAFANDDMYVCPNWDKFLMDEIESRKDDLFFYSSTLIEPVDSGNRCVIAPQDYGTSPANFNEEKLLAEYNSLNKKDWSGATWPPNIVSMRIWDLVGGYSTEFSPGMYSDPDFSKKLWEVGVRDFRGIAASRVYHFMSKTVSRIKKNNGRKQFLLKWDMTSSTFMNFYLKRGDDYSGPLSAPEETFRFKKKAFTTKLKRFFTT